MREFSAIAAALLLAAGVAAAVSAGTVRFAPGKPNRIASVRLSSLTADFIAKTHRQGGNNEEALAAARDWGARLEEALARVAARRGVVLLTAGAVAAGAEDLTTEVEAEMAELAPKTSPNREKNNADDR